MNRLLSKSCWTRANFPYENWFPESLRITLYLSTYWLIISEKILWNYKLCIIGRKYSIFTMILCILGLFTQLYIIHLLTKLIDENWRFFSHFRRRRFYYRKASLVASFEVQRKGERIRLVKELDRRKGDCMVALSVWPS